MDTEHAMNGATEPAPAPEPVDLAELVDAVNAQVVPQLAHLAEGPLAQGSLQALAAAMQRGEPTTTVVLQVRVKIRGRLYALAVQCSCTP